MSATAANLAGERLHAAVKRTESSGASSSDESELRSGSVPISRASSTDDLSTSASTSVRKRPESLKERGRIPNSFYITMTCIVLLEGCSGMYKLDTIKSWWSSISTSARTVYDHLDYLKMLMQSAFDGELREPKEYVVATVTTAVAASLIGIFIYSPFRAGVWTGRRASKHKIHRYMGLIFLIQYGLVWVEFLTKNGGSGSLGFLPHALALNGTFTYLPRFCSELLFSFGEILTDECRHLHYRNRSRILCLFFFQSPS